mgnify:CR=1 FL=1
MRCFFQRTVHYALALVCLVHVAGASEMSPRAVLDRYVAGHATRTDSCCVKGACAMLEPTATPDEVNAYLRDTVQVGSRFNSTGSRWNNTVRTPGTSLGDPVVITYSFVPDGVTIPSNTYHGQTGSNLNSALNGQFGGQGWKDVYRQVFARWSELSGIRYAEVDDDGAGWGSAGSSSRGDVRIFGAAIPGSVAAYNYYPGSGTGGDMVLDTSYGWSSSGNNHRGLRNVCLLYTSDAADE